MTSDASRYEEAQNVLEKSEDAVERSRAVEALADDLSTMCVHDLLDSLEAATEEEEVERQLVRLVREFPLADAGIWAYRPVSRAADASIVEAWRTHLRTNPSFDALEAAWTWCRGRRPDVTELVAEGLHALWDGEAAERRWRLVGRIVANRAQPPERLVRDVLVKSTQADMASPTARWAVVRAAFMCGGHAKRLLERKMAGERIAEHEAEGPDPAWIAPRLMREDPIHQLDRRYWPSASATRHDAAPRDRRLVRLLRDLKSRERRVSRRAFVTVVRERPEVSVFPAFWQGPGWRIVERAYFRVVTRRSSSVRSVKNALGMLIAFPVSQAIRLMKVVDVVHGTRPTIPASLAAVGATALRASFAHDTLEPRDLASRLVAWVARSSLEREAGAAERMRDATGALEVACVTLFHTDPQLVLGVVDGLHEAWVGGDDRAVHRVARKLLALVGQATMSGSRRPRWRHYRRGWLEG